MKYLTILFCFLAFSKTMAQPFFTLPSQIDSMYTVSERDSLKRGSIPYKMQILMDKERREYAQKLKEFFKKTEKRPFQTLKPATHQVLHIVRQAIMDTFG